MNIFIYLLIKERIKIQYYIIYIFQHLINNVITYAKTYLYIYQT